MNSPQTEYKIISAQDIAEMDTDRLTKLINDSFEDKKLIENYFDEEKEAIKEIFYEENYLSAAIIQSIESLDNIFYIDKYVVEESYQGNGLGTTLWNAITAKYDKLIWRASPGNPANKFYKGKYNGMEQTHDWNIYYKGLNDLQDNELNELIVAVANKEPTMIYKQP